MPSHIDDPRPHPALLLALWVGSVAAVGFLAQRFWIPLDDGTLAQSAERVLLGELPHRDFGDPYTGLNAIVGALAFRFLGVELSSLRIPLVMAFAAWLPAVWLLARRFVTSTQAVAATLLAGVLSVPAYPAAMPTWFGLFLVTWGLWALLRFLDEAGRSWLLVVGAAAGLSLLFKVTGLYFLAAALLTLARRRSDGSPAYLAVTVMGVGLFLVVLGRLVLPGGSGASLYHFFLPGFALCLAVLVGATLQGSQDDGGLRALWTDIAWLMMGTLAPVLLFLLPYAASGSVGAWFDGVFLLPSRRLEAAASPPGAAWTIVPGLIAVVVAWGGSQLAGVGARRVAIGVLVLLTASLALDDTVDGGVMAAFWYAARGWIPPLCVVAAWRASTGYLQGTGASTLIAVAATAGLWALVQFPYAAPAYFFYVAPLGVLASLAVFRNESGTVGPVVGVLAGVVAFLGLGYAWGVAASATTELDLPRGGIRVSAPDAAMYGALVSEVRTHAGGGGLWSGPDTPEVYFLTGLPNPGSTLYEFLDASPPDPLSMERILDENAVRVVVVNPRPLFSRPLGPDVLAVLERRYPENRTVGSYLVRWSPR